MIITMQQCTSLSEDTANVGGYFQRGLGSERRWPTCTCPAYKFSKRTINFGGRMVAPPCKHILQAQGERCGWHQQWGDERQEKAGICPRCGESTEYIDVYI